MNSSNDTQTLPKASSAPIALEIRGLGHCPSFKNTKSIYRRKDGKPFIATKPERKQWMGRATRAIALQLHSKCQMELGAMPTAQQLRSWTASHTPLDDSWQWIPELHIRTVKVPKGEEGATMTIERVEDVEAALRGVGK